QQIMNGYYEILLRQYLLKTFTEQRDVSFFRRDFLQSRFDVGNAAEVEVIKATVDFNGDQFAVTNQEAEVAKAKVNLNQLIARDVNIDFSIDTTISLNQNFTYDQLVSDMLAHNKDLQLTEQNVQLASLDVKRSNAAYYPMVALNGGYNFLKSKSEAGFVSANQNQSIYYGATLSWNLFDGLNSRREKQNAVITQKNSELQKEDVQLQLTSYLKQLFLDYQNNIGLIDLERKNLTYAEKNLDIAQESFKLGVTSDLELREVQKNLVDAKVRLSGAAYRAKLQEAALMRMTGKLVQ
ncbi:MAG: TolC family protein, partial [Chitinophagales bacterium]|nr:TolC family protein [Chitinophagales bacterium]